MLRTSQIPWRCAVEFDTTVAMDHSVATMVALTKHTSIKGFVTQDRGLERLPQNCNVRISRPSIAALARPVNAENMHTYE